MTKKVIIIGGGIAGLSAGIYSAMNGFDTEIIEMHSVAGGQCTAWDRSGYRFDYCLHWLVGTSKGAFHDIWVETNVLNDKTEVIDHQIHSRIFDKERNEFIIYSNIDRWEKYLLEFAPEDRKTIKVMCNDMRKSTLLEPFALPPELRSFFDYIKIIPVMLPIINLVRKFGRLTCKEYFEKLNFKNERLRSTLLSFYGDRNFSALAFVFMLGFFNQKIGMTKLDYGYSVMNYHYDSTMAPKDKTAIVLRFESPWKLWENLEGENYRLEKEQIKKDAVKILETEYPGISEFIEVIDVATPKTDVRFTGVKDGAYEGFMPSKENMMNNLDMQLPKLKNFYMAGQWLFPGGGLPPSAQTGKWAVQLICKKENIKFISDK
jgi:phytoene dehydrogenase-like protein